VAVPVEVTHGHRIGPAVALESGSVLERFDADQPVPRAATPDGRSERPEGQRSVHEERDARAVLLVSLELTPAHVVANSYGGNIVLRLAATGRSSCAA
jgi:pimeloyl-ACP methyl ester carboxylesterase